MNRTSTDFQYDVFLSRNQADKPRVRRLAERLRLANLRVWFDEWVIQPGDGPSPVGRERLAEGWVRGRELPIPRGLEASRTLVLCFFPAPSVGRSNTMRPAYACERGWHRHAGLRPLKDHAKAFLR